MSQTPMIHTGNNTPIFDKLMAEFKERQQHVDEIMQRPINTEPYDWNSFSARKTTPKWGSDGSLQKVAETRSGGDREALLDIADVWDGRSIDGEYYDEMESWFSRKPALRRLSDGAKKMAEERAASKELAIRVVDKRPVSLPELEHQLKTEAEIRRENTMRNILDEETHEMEKVDFTKTIIENKESIGDLFDTAEKVAENVIEGISAAVESIGKQDLVTKRNHIVVSLSEMARRANTTSIFDRYKQERI